MNFPSVTGKNWIYKKFNSSDVSIFTEKYSLTEIAAKLLSIRKDSIDNLEVFLDPKIKNSLPKKKNLCLPKTRPRKYSSPFLNYLVDFLQRHIVQQIYHVK